MRVRGPLADSYPAAVVLVICALVPYLALTSSITPLTPVITKQVGLSQQSLQLTNGMANAAYAFGTVMAVQLAVHLRGRRILLGYAALFVIASVLVALDLDPGLFIAGRVVQGMCTSLMLIAAVPPLVTGWPVGKTQITGIVMNLCVFGAVAVGPVVGGVQAGAGDWRPLFWIVAGIGALALLFALLTFEDDPPSDPDAPWDWAAMLLAGGGCAAAFFGASELQTHALLSPIVIVPLAAGVLAVIVLVIDQYVVDHPLMPVRSLCTTFPVIGVLTAMCAGAASVGLVDLAEKALQPRGDPIHTAMLFWPEFGGAVATALLFGALFRTRLVPVLAFAGLLVLAGGAAVLNQVTTATDAVVLVGSGLVGLGVGASVSPALFMSGFSLRSKQLQRVFALIELLRGVAAFLVAPVLAHVAMTTGGSQAQGTTIAVWVCFGLAAGCAAVAACLFALGRARLQRPDLDRWLADEGPAWESPPPLDALRQRGAPASRPQSPAA